jgi:hypothetical protein
LKTAVEKLDGREFKGVRVTCTADVCIGFSNIWLSLTCFRRSQISLAIVLGLVLLAGALILLMIMIVVVQYVDTALAVTGTVTEAPLDAAIMTMTAVAMVAPLHALALLLMIIHPLVVEALMILIVATTLLLTRMLMAMGDLLMIDLRRETIRQGMQAMPIMIAAAVTGNFPRLMRPICF